jgi:hypothetical protein
MKCYACGKLVGYGMIPACVPKEKSRLMTDNRAIFPATVPLLMADL